MKYTWRECKREAPFEGGKGPAGEGKDRRQELERVVDKNKIKTWSYGLVTVFIYSFYYVLGFSFVSHFGWLVAMQTMPASNLKPSACLPLPR